MKKRVLSVLTAAALCLSLLPAPVWAAEETDPGEHQIRTETLVLTNETQEDAEEGWSWGPDPDQEGGYILTLDNVTIEAAGGPAIEFRMDKAYGLGPVTIQLTGQNSVSSETENGIAAYIDYQYMALPKLIITGDALEVGCYKNGFYLPDCEMTVQNAEVEVCARREAESDQIYGIYLGSGGALLLGDCTVQANRILTGTLNAQRSRLTAYATGGGYSRKIIDAADFAFTGGKLTVYGPEGKDNVALYSGSYGGGTPIRLSDCEIDIHDVQQGVRSVTGDISLNNVEGTIFTTQSSANNSVYENNAFDGLGEETCTDCHILAQTGADGSVQHTYIYGDHTLTEDASWPSTGLHIQKGCTLTVDEGAKLTMTADVTVHGNYEEANAVLVNNGTLEFAEDNRIWADLINNGTLLVSGFLDCAPENFTNNGTFDGIMDDSAQRIFGNAAIKYNQTLGKWSPTSYWSDTIYVTENAVLTIPDGKTLDASQSEKGITSETLEQYLAVAMTGRIVVEQGGRLLLPAGITQEQLDALHLSGAGTVMAGDEKAPRVTLKDGGEVLSNKLLVPGGRIVSDRSFDKEGYTLLWCTDEEGTQVFDLKEPVTEDVTLYAKWLKNLPASPEPEEDKVFQVVMETGVTQVPEALKNDPKLDAAEKIETALRMELTGGSIPEENTAVYDVDLLVSTDGGITWRRADRDNFPKEGLTVTLPYPEGSDDKCTFTVVHMFTTDEFGQIPGSTEQPPVTNETEGIRFTVKGLSPISVGWTEPETGGTSHSSGNSHTSKPETAEEAIKPCDGGADCPASRFTDLDLSRWYHDGIHFCVERGLMAGTSGTTFAPDGKVSRAMAVTILWQLQGSPEAENAVGYGDVDRNAWYAKAVRWAASEGIAAGYSDDSFGPNDPVTRQQLAVMLYHYEQKYGGGGFTGQWMFLLDYQDRDQVGEWAYEAVCWMTMNRVMEGKGDKVFDPRGHATRAEAAAMIQQYVKATEE